MLTISEQQNNQDMNNQYVVNIVIHKITKKNRRMLWTDKNSLTPPLFIQLSTRRQESKRLCICVLGISMFAYCFGFWNCFDGVVFSPILFSFRSFILSYTGSFTKIVLTDHPDRNITQLLNLYSKNWMRIPINRPINTRKYITTFPRSGKDDILKQTELISRLR